MKYEVVVVPAARRELDALPADALHRVDPAIRALGDAPRPLGVKKLEKDLHRIRVGPWRVIYAIRDAEQRVVILHVVRRSERTYKRF